MQQVEGGYAWAQNLCDKTLERVLTHNLYCNELEREEDTKYIRKNSTMILKNNAGCMDNVLPNPLDKTVDSRSGIISFPVRHV